MPSLSEKIRKGIDVQARIQSAAFEKDRLESEKEEREEKELEVGPKEQEKLLKRAGRNFEKYLLPIFEEIGEMKDISIDQDPYETRGFLGRKIISEKPEQPGFYMREDCSGYFEGEAYVKKGWVVGCLIWDIETSRAPNRVWDVTYRKLEAVIDSDGFVGMGQGHGEFDSSVKSEMDKFREQVVSVMIKNGSLGNWKYVSPEELERKRRNDEWEQSH